MENIWQALLISMISGLATTAGSLFVIMLGQPGERVLSLLLAGSGGVMLAVVSLDLLPMAWNIGPLSQILSGLLLGLLFMQIAHKLLNSADISLPLSRRQRLKRLGLLVASGIALHDLPEGMAIALGQEASENLGLIIALAITLHNFPEGMATTAPLIMARIRTWKIVLLNLGIAFFTPLGALIGIFALDATRNSFAFYLTFAAGAMTFLVFAELLPLSRERHPHYALLGIAVGFTFFATLGFIFPV
jgi:ZIP family zinc transporter